MPTLTFTFDTGAVPVTRITDAMAVVYGYKTNVQDPAFPTDPTKTIPNPQTKAQFAREIVKKILINNVQDADRRAAMAAATVNVTPIDLT